MTKLLTCQLSLCQTDLITVSFIWLTFMPYYATTCIRRRSFVRRCSSITKRAARIIPERFDFHTNSLYSHTGYDMTNDVRSEVIVKKLAKLLPPISLGRIFPELFKRGSPNFTHLLRTVGFTNVQNMTSLTASIQL